MIDNYIENSSNCITYLGGFSKGHSPHRNDLINENVYKKEKLKKTLIGIGGFFIFAGFSLVMIIGAFFQMIKE